MVVEVAGQRLFAAEAVLTRIAAVGQPGQHPGVTFTGDHRVQHLPPGHAVQVTDHRSSLIWASSSSFSSRCFSRVCPAPGCAGSG